MPVSCMLSAREGKPDQQIFPSQSCGCELHQLPELCEVSKLPSESFKVVIQKRRAETIIISMQLHLPFFVLGFLSVFSCSCYIVGNCSSGAFQNEFLTIFWEEGKVEAGGEEGKLSQNNFLLGNSIDRGSVNGGFQMLVRVWSGEQVPAPQSNLSLASSLTSVFPQCYLSSTSFYLILTPAQPAISNHGLETMVYRPLARKNLRFCKLSYGRLLLFQKNSGRLCRGEAPAAFLNQGPILPEPFSFP